MKNVNPVLLIGLGVLGIIFLGAVVYQTWQWTVEYIYETSNQQARLVIELDNALRTYVGKHIGAEMDKRVEPDQFIPEAMSTSFVARNIFEGVREKYPDFIMRFPSTNPHNPVNKATDSEQGIIRYFEEHPGVQSWSGILDVNGARHFVRAIPRRFEQACLRCHGRPQGAPASLVERYGPTAGFGRSVGEISLDLVGIPLDSIYAQARAKAKDCMVFALVVWSLFIGGIAFLIRMDVLQRRRSEQTLRASEERYRTLFVEAMDGICLADAETGIIIDCNQAMATLVGRDRMELIGQHQRILHPPAVHDSVFSPTFKQHLTDKDKQVLDAQVVTRAGEIREVEIKANRLYLFGKTMLQGMFRDITERKKAEQMTAEANEKLREANKQLQEFTYIVSHDLREPTRKITAFGQVLAESLLDKLSDNDKENLHFMIDGADRMDQMIESLLEYSRVTTKSVAFEPVDLNEIIEQLKSVELALKVEETGGIVLLPVPLPPVKTDPVQIRQLLQNLISNALKYHKKGVAPEIVIRAKGQEDGMVRIEIQDNGIGIKREQVGSLFVMFRRLHQRSEYEGMGIGLAVCRRIVERHGGRIGVESVYGEGSTFWFTLPAASAAAEANELITSVSGSAT